MSKPVTDNAEESIPGSADPGVGSDVELLEGENKPLEVSSVAHNGYEETAEESTPNGLHVVGDAGWTAVRRTLGDETSIRDTVTKNGVLTKMEEDFPADNLQNANDYGDLLADEMEEIADEIEASPGDEGWRDMMYFSARINDDFAWLVGRPGILGISAGLALNSPKELEFDEIYANIHSDWPVPESQTAESVLSSASNYLNYNLGELAGVEGAEIMNLQPFEEVSALYLGCMALGVYGFDKGLNGVNNYFKKVSHLTENQDEIAQTYRDAANELRQDGSISDEATKEVYKDRRTPLKLGHVHRIYDEESEEWKRNDPEDLGTYGLILESIKRSAKKPIEYFRS